MHVVRVCLRYAVHDVSMARGGVLFVRVSQPRDGETSAECACREMYEETAHAIDVPAGRWRTTYTDRNGVLSGVVVPGETRKHECTVAVALLLPGEYAGAAPAPLLAEHESLVWTDYYGAVSDVFHRGPPAVWLGGHVSEHLKDARSALPREHVTDYSWESVSCGPFASSVRLGHMTRHRVSNGVPGLPVLMAHNRTCLLWGARLQFGEHHASRWDFHGRGPLVRWSPVCSAPPQAAAVPRGVRGASPVALADSRLLGARRLTAACRRASTCCRCVPAGRTAAALEMSRPSGGT